MPPLAPRQPPSGARQGPVEAASLPCHAQHAAAPNAATRGGLHVSVHKSHAHRDLPLHPHPVPRAYRPARRFARVCGAHLTRSLPRWGFPRLYDPQAVPAGPLAGLCSVQGSRWVWQAEEAVADLPVRLAVRVHCGFKACAQHDGIPVG